MSLTVGEKIVLGDTRRSINRRSFMTRCCSAVFGTMAAWYAPMCLRQEEEAGNWKNWATAGSSCTKDEMTEAMRKIYDDLEKGFWIGSKTRVPIDHPSLGIDYWMVPKPIAESQEPQPLDVMP